MLRCGWRAFVQKRDDFPLLYSVYWAFTLLGHQAASARAATLSPT